MPCRELLYRCSCNIYACWPSVTVRSQHLSCSKHAYWSSTAARWMLAGLWPLISMPADLLPLNNACLLVVCFSICYCCWYGVSLSAVPAGVLLHYRSCLLALYLTISHACWCCASLKAMYAGVVPHCRSCLLAWRVTIGHACWRGTSI